MADPKDKKTTTSKVVKKKETVRERAEKATTGTPKARRLRATASKVSRPIGAVKRAGGREFYLPMPDNKFGRFLNKRRRITPRFLIEAWKELRRVEWPTARETVRLTFAVFIFSIAFGIVIALVDYGLDKVFRKVFLK